jgi:hypothetical protein
MTGGRRVAANSGRFWRSLVPRHPACLLTSRLLVVRTQLEQTTPNCDEASYLIKMVP